MHAVEIEEAVSRLAEQPFDAESFPYAFLEAFCIKPTTIQRLRSGDSNQSDLGGVLQRSNIHLKACAPSQVSNDTLERILAPGLKRCGMAAGRHFSTWAIRAWLLIRGEARFMGGTMTTWILIKQLLRK